MSSHSSLSKMRTTKGGVSVKKASYLLLYPKSKVLGEADWKKTYHHQQGSLLEGRREETMKGN